MIVRTCTCICSTAVTHGLDNTALAFVFKRYLSPHFYTNKQVSDALLNKPDSITVYENKFGNTRQPRKTIQLPGEGFNLLLTVVSYSSSKTKFSFRHSFSVSRHYSR